MEKKRKRGFSASNLVAAREMNGKTQEEIAGSVGIAQNQYSRYENGTSEPSGYLIKQLAMVLDVSTDYLLGLVDTPGAHIRFEDLSPEERQLIIAFRNHNFADLVQIAGKKAEPEH